MLLKEKILKNLSDAIKDLQASLLIEEGEFIAINNEEAAAYPLLEELDHVFLHGLKNINQGYFQPVLEFTRKDVISELKHLAKVTTNIGRSRSWLYHALNEGLMESYISCFIDNARVVGRYYQAEALLLHSPSLQVLSTLISIFEHFKFQLTYDVSYLDTGCYIPNQSLLNPFTSVSSLQINGIDKGDAVTENNATSLMTSFKNICLDIDPTEELIEHNKNRKRTAGGKRKLEDRVSTRRISRSSTVSSIHSDTSSLVAAGDVIENGTSIKCEREVLTSPESADDEEGIIGSMINYLSDEASNRVESKSSPVFDLMLENESASQQISDDVDDCEVGFHSPSGITFTETLYKPLTVKCEEGGSLSSCTSDSKSGEKTPVIDDIKFNEDEDLVISLEGGRDEIFSIYDDDMYKQEKQEEYVVSVEDENTVKTKTLQETSSELLQLYGEIKLDANLQVILRLNISTGDNELLHKLYHVSFGATEGTSTTIFLLLSSRGVYLLEGQPTMSHQDNNVFGVVANISYEQIDYLSLSIAYQWIQIVCKSRRTQYWICTYSEELTKSIVSNMEICIRSNSSSDRLPLPSVLTDATTQKIAIDKWLAGELHIERHTVDLKYYGIIHWEDFNIHHSKPNSENSSDRQIQGGGASIKDGTLSYRVKSLYVVPLFNYTSNWKTAYIELRDDGLYIYTTTDQRPYFVSLSGRECSGCRRITLPSDSHNGNCIEIKQFDGRTVQLAAESEEDATNWLQASLAVISKQSLSTDIAVARSPLSTPSDGSAISCILCLTEQAFFLAHEELQTGFVRTIASAKPKDLTSIVEDVQPHMYPYIMLEFESMETNISDVYWLVYFNTLEEMSRCETALKQIWFDLFHVPIVVSRNREDVRVRRCREGSDLIRLSWKRSDNVYRGRSNVI